MESAVSFAQRVCQFPRVGARLAFCGAGQPVFPRGGASIPADLGLIFMICSSSQEDDAINRIDKFVTQVTVVHNKRRGAGTLGDRLSRSSVGATSSSWRLSVATVMAN